jgi:hypothetical protein
MTASVLLLLFACNFASAFAIWVVAYRKGYQQGFRQASCKENNNAITMP